MISIYGLLMSMNDPGWGRDKNNGSGNDNGNKPPNQGPPDLDELWRDFNRRLQDLFGSKGGRGGGDRRSGPRSDFDPKYFRSGLVIFLLVLFVIWMASGIYIVNAPQRGVVLQFGKVKEITNPGMHWHIPFPIQTAELVDLTSTRSVEIGYRGNQKMLNEALMLTDDENIIDIQFAIQYKLNDPEAYLFNNREPDDAVTQAAESAIREVVGKNKMDFLLYEGREAVAATTQALLQKILDDYKTGILISKVTMQNAQPPEQVQAAFDDAVKAGQDKERQVNEGQAYANDVIPRAEGTKSRILEEAIGYKQSAIAIAQGDASRFQQLSTEYDKAPEVTRQRLFLETIQQVYSNTSKVMIDAKGAGNLLYLPLDKLMQGSSMTPMPAPAITDSRPKVSGRSSTTYSTATTSERPPQIERPPAVETRMSSMSGMSGMSSGTLSRSREESMRARDQQ